MVVTQLALNVRTKLATALTRQEGQGMVEYALIIVLVAIGVIVAITALRTQLETVFNTVVNSLSTAS
jgi:pilus assembly protein Flp/PilA